MTAERFGADGPDPALVDKVARAFHADIRLSYGSVDWESAPMQDRLDCLAEAELMLTTLFSMPPAERKQLSKVLRWRPAVTGERVGCALILAMIVAIAAVIVWEMVTR